MTEHTIINVSLASDERYVPHLAATLSSVLANCPGHVWINAYILSNGISVSSQAKLEKLREIKDFTPVFISVDPAYFQGCTVTLHTVTMYYRLRLPELLSHESKVIYLDCDVLVRGSLEDLWNTDVTGAPFAACPDSMLLVGDKSQRAYVSQFGSNYYNSGVLLINLEEMRRRRAQHEILEWIRRRSSNGTLRYPDQDAINSLYGDVIVPLPLRWNYQFPVFGIPELLESEPAIVHFTTQNKPWMYAPEPQYKSEYWSYLRMTPWKFQKPEGKTCFSTIRKQLLRVVACMRVKRFNGRAGGCLDTFGFGRLPAQARFRHGSESHLR